MTAGATHQRQQIAVKSFQVARELHGQCRRLRVVFAVENEKRMSELGDRGPEILRREDDADPVVMEDLARIRHIAPLRVGCGGEAARQRQQSCPGKLQYGAPSPRRGQSGAAYCRLSAPSQAKDWSDAAWRANVARLCNQARYSRLESLLKFSNKDRETGPPPIRISSISSAPGRSACRYAYGRQSSL